MLEIAHNYTRDAQRRFIFIHLQVASARKSPSSPKIQPPWFGPSKYEALCVGVNFGPFHDPLSNSNGFGCERGVAWMKRGWGEGETRGPIWLNISLGGGRDSRRIGWKEGRRKWGLDALLSIVSSLKHQNSLSLKTPPFLVSVCEREAEHTHDGSLSTNSHGLICLRKPSPWKPVTVLRRPPHDLSRLEFCVYVVGAIRRPLNIHDFPILSLTLTHTQFNCLLVFAKPNLVGPLYVHFPMQNEGRGRAKPHKSRCRLTATYYAQWRRWYLFFN